MKPLSVGLLGCGHIAPAHVHAWSRDRRFRLLGAFDVDAEAARRLVAPIGSATVFESSERLIDACDVVDICTPPATHFPLVAGVIESDKHLVVEKPIVVLPAEWQQVRAALETFDATLSVVHHIKFTRLIQTVKRWLDSGRLGRLLRIETYFATHPGVDRMLTDRPHWSHALPGGRWFETLPHNLYLTHFLAGPLAFEHVTSLRTPAAPAGAPADEIQISLRGEDVLGSIHFSAHCRHNYRWAVLTGTEGVLRMDLLSGALALDRVRDRPASRALGRLFLQAASALGRAPLDRALYLGDRLARRSPHSMLVQQLGNQLFENGPAPTSIEEIRYTVESCFEIAAAIETSLAGE